MWEWFGDFNDGELLFLGRWGTILLSVLGLGVLAVLVLSYLDLRDMRPRRRAWTLLTLRGLVLLWGLTLLLEPALELRAVKRVKTHVGVLFDGSRSMQVDVPAGGTRWQAAQRALDQLEPRINDPDGDHRFEFIRFGEAPEQATLASLKTSPMAAEPEATRIRRALDHTVEQIGIQNLGGIVLLSDGSDDGVLSGRNPPGEALDVETRRFIERLNVPIHVLAVSPLEGLRDVAVEDVRHDDFAFIHNRMAMDISLRGLGLDNTSVEVQLWRDGERIRAQRVSFESDNDSQEVTFEVVPDRIGKSVFSVQVLPVEGEAIEDNNAYHFVVKVIRDKIRVLQVCGRPSNDERFMRRLLKENPNVDLISFFILRTGEDIQVVPQRELSLIPFPKDELFDEQLPSFDLVIFQDFNFGPYMFDLYLNRLSQFVRDGGAFLMIGGHLSFSNGGYAGTPIEEVLPVTLEPLNIFGDDPKLISTAMFAPDLTQAGARHPITRLAFEPVENRRLWEALPKLEGTNVVNGLAPGAVALAHHPSIKTRRGDPMPVIAVRDVGKGRSMAFTTDTSWFWSFGFASQGGTARPYNNFWNNAIRWLIRDPELKLIKIETVQTQVLPGQMLEATVRVLDPDYAPAPNVEGAWRLTRRPLDHAGGREDSDEVVVVAEGRFVTNASGTYELQEALEEPGVYTVQATVKRSADGMPLRQGAAASSEAGELMDRDIVLATTHSPELRTIAPRNDLLRQLAAASEGEYIELPVDAEALMALPFAPPRVIEVERRQLVSIWDVWWTFLIMGALLTVEWLFRRRWGRI